MATQFKKNTRSTKFDSVGNADKNGNVRSRRPCAKYGPAGEPKEKKIQKSRIKTVFDLKEQGTNISRRRKNGDLDPLPAIWACSLSGGYICMRSVKIFPFLLPDLKQPLPSPRFLFYVPSFYCRLN